MRKTLLTLCLFAVLFWPVLLWRDQFFTVDEAVGEKGSASVEVRPRALPMVSAKVDRVSQKVSESRVAKVSPAPLKGGVPKDVLSTGTTSAAAGASMDIGVAPAVAQAVASVSVQPPIPTTVSAGFGGGGVGPISVGGSTAGGRDVDDEVCPML